MYDLAIGAFFGAWALVLIAIKLFKTVDEDGTVGKAAETGFADWLKHWFK
jgi:hypothetical protein